MRLRGIVFCLILCSTKADLLQENLSLFDVFNKQSRGGYFTNPIKGVKAVLAAKCDDILSNSTDLEKALYVMDYHRLMMNEFLSENFIRSQIQNFFISPSQYGRRMGYVRSDELLQNKHIGQDHKPKFLNYTKNYLLKDEGSQKYRAWLGSINTLNNIHHQLAIKSEGEIFFPNKNRRKTSLIGPIFDVSEASTDFDYGDITGYALDSSANNYVQPLFNQSKFEIKSGYNKINRIENNILNALSKQGMQDKLEYENPAFLLNYQRSSVALKHPNELSLKDIADIALTTLAFLSFGMFILQVLMCITMGKEDNTNLMVLPMEETEFNNLPNDGVEEIRRKKRTIKSHGKTLTMTNEIARRIIFSIESMVQFPQNEDNSCHYWSMCKNNQFGLEEKMLNKYWLPLWSLGTTWLASKVRANLQVHNEYKFILKSLNAISVGLSGENCKNKLTMSCKPNKN